MRGHIIPQVYQKKWHTSVSEENVFYFDKNDLTKPLSQNGGNVEKNLYRKDEYIITETDEEYGLSCTDSYELEKYLSYSFENFWNDITINSGICTFLENTQVNSNNVALIIRANMLKNTPFNSDLRKQLIIQYLRIYENFKRIEDKLLSKQIDNAAEIYERAYGAAIPKSEVNDLKNDDNFKRALWKKMLLNCKNEQSNTILEATFNGLQYLTLAFVYIKNNIKSKFILSDNPIVWNNDDSNGIQTGIYFPIMPNLMVAFFNYPNDERVGKDDAFCLFADDDFVKSFNSILLKQSFSKVGFMDLSIANHIDNNIYFNKSLFKIMNINEESK